MRQKMHNKTYCKFAETGLFFSHRGPGFCCHPSKPFPGLTVNQWWHSEYRKQSVEKMKKGIKVKDCIGCYQMEENNEISPRMGYNKKFDLSQQKKELPKRIELDLSNFCNLKCIMCSSSRSSQWAKEEGLYTETNGIRSMSTEMLDDICKISKELEYLTIQGGVPAGGAGSPSLSDNTILGGSNTLFVDVANAALTGSAPYFSAIRNIIGGNSLVVSGSSALAHTQTYGSAFFGRFNANDGIRNKTAQTVFSVGTGTSTTNRKTGFLIDSGSNTFVEGTFNVSGSTSLTGSLTIQSGSSFFANGNKQFNVGAFQSNITQSGSANVSQSMNFETTDISSGVSIASNSRITLENSGTYNIQFSAQIDRVSGSGTDTVHIWLKKNGTNVSASAGAVTISGLAAAAKTIAAWNYVVDAAANDYYELVWEATDSNIQLINQAAGGNIPSTPSIILTVTQVR